MKTDKINLLIHLLTGKLLIPVLLLLVIMPGTSFSQQNLKEESLFVTNYSMEDGMRQSMVSQIYQDKRGLIWMVTGDGLHCFDGKQFRIYRVPFNDVYNHTDNLMRGLTGFSSDILTLASSSSILNFNISTAAFKIVYRKDGSYPMLLNLKINNKPVAWLQDLKLCVIENNKIIPINFLFEDKNKLPAAFLPSGAIRYNSNEFLISGSDGVLIVSHLPTKDNSPMGARWMGVKNCQALAKDRKGRAFILSGGVIMKYYGNGKMTKFFDTRLTQNTEMFIDSRDNFWLWSKSNSDLYRLSGDSLTKIMMFLHNDTHIDAISPNIKSVFEDNHGNLWFGTDSDGVILYSPGQVQFDQSAIGFVRCLTWYNDNLWAGTFHNGLWKLSSDLLKSERILPERFNDNIYFLDLTTDRNNHLWLATRKGIDVMDVNGKIVFSHRFDSYLANFIYNKNDTLTLACDNRLYYFYSGTRPHLIKSTDFVPLTTYIEDGDAQWFGNQFGLYRSTRSFGEGVSNIFSSSNRISYKQVYCLIKHQGKIWSATGNGIEIFDPEGKLLPAIGSISELQNDVIYSLIPDEQGRVWFTCNQGIGCIPAKKDHIMRFKTQHNLQSLEFNYNAGYKAPDGRIYFGGIRGVNGFKPSGFSSGGKIPDVRMIELFIGDSLFTNGISPGYVKILLDRESPHINGKVFCSDFTDAGARLYSFFLEGYQKRWSKPSYDPEFSYRDLPPGEYRLMAKCADAWHNWSEPTVLLSVKLRPPFWKTWWFLLLLIIIIATLTAFTVKRINSIRYRQHIKELEQRHAIEKERLRISKDMHDEVGASLTRISILSELAKNQKNEPEKSGQIISQISEISGNVVDELSEIIWAMNPKNDSLDSFTAYVRRYASTYLETAEIDVHFNIPVNVPALLMTSEIRRNLFLTIKEALHNIVKHSEAEIVHLTIRLNNAVVTFEINDNGRGFGYGSNPGIGNGLINMQRRVEECGGKYELLSEPGKGTKILFSIGL